MATRGARRGQEGRSASFAHAHHRPRARPDGHQREGHVADRTVRLKAPTELELVRIRGAASLPVGTTRRPCFANVRARTPRRRSSSAARVRHARERHVLRRASPRARRRREYAVARLDKNDRCDHDGRSLRAPGVVSEELGSSARSCPLARSFAHGRRKVPRPARSKVRFRSKIFVRDKLLLDYRRHTRTCLGLAHDSRGKMGAGEGLRAEPRLRHGAVRCCRSRRRRRTRIRRLTRSQCRSH